MAPKVDVEFVVRSVLKSISDQRSPDITLHAIQQNPDLLVGAMGSDGQL
jgi:hypothetical protein